MGGNDRMVFVYFNNGTQFANTHNITGFASDIWAVDITADGQWLLVVEFIGINRIYRFGSSNKFE